MVASGVVLGQRIDFEGLEDSRQGNTNDESDSELFKSQISLVAQEAKKRDSAGLTGQCT